MVLSIILFVVSIIMIALYFIRRRRLKHVKIASNDIFDGPFGNIIEIDKTSGHVTYIKDSYGKESWFRYDNRGRVIEYKDADVHQMYTYNNNIRVLLPFDRKKAKL